MSYLGSLFTFALDPNFQCLPQDQTGGNVPLLELFCVDLVHALWYREACQLYSVIVDVIIVV
jgi:hypothetical protein